MHVLCSHIPHVLCTLLEPMEMLKEKLKKQLPSRLLIPNNCIRLIGTLGQGQCLHIFEEHKTNML